MTVSSAAVSVPARSVLEIAEALACPWCAGKMRVESEAIRCLACARVYPVQDGIALLARTGTPEAPREAQGGPTDVRSSAAYQQQYQKVTDAQRYNESYRKLLPKRNSTRREHRILHELLGSQGRCETLLDLPAGGGRLSPALEEHTELLIEADIAHGQVLYGALHSTLRAPAVRMTASAFHIPFQDGGVDGTVCCRLCHHLPTPAERERLVVELLRVSRRFALMTFFDHDSLKNRWRRVRQPFDKQPPKMTMTVAQVRALARENGAELVACPALFTLFSGHRFALMVKQAAKRTA
jgi:uncharacterized protein YbaR (Trm112 family)/ubiquinone/menaquinone biosynthesis C-methylase UbiE